MAFSTRPHFLDDTIEARSTRKGKGRTFPACAAGSNRFRCIAAVLIGLTYAASIRADDKVTYDDHVAAIFKQRCSSCHNPNAKKADLDVTNFVKLMQGGASGAVIEPGNADASYLFALVTHQSEPFMPQNADKLSDADIELIRNWINGGALENAGSKAAKPKPKMAVVAETVIGKRPDVIPVPPRMVLEPAFHSARPPMARSLATSPWAPLVAVAGQRQVLLYNTTTLELVGVFPFPEGQPNVVRFSRDGRLLLAGGGRPAASGKVVVWDITTAERVFEVGKELDVVLAADISADHKRIALGGPQRLVRVYSTETGELQYEIAKHTEWVLSVEFSPDGVLLATTDRNGGLFVWETETGHEYLTLNGHTAAVTAVAWRRDSNVLASASEDATVRLWEMENGTPIKNWNAKAALLTMDFTRDGRLITGGRDQIVRLWDQEGKQLVETKPIGDVAVSVAFCDESLRAFAANWAGTVQVCKADDAAVLGNLDTNPQSLSDCLTAANETLQKKLAAAAPLTEAVRKAETEFNTAQAALVASQQKAGMLQADAERLTAEGTKIGQARAATEAERANLAATISQNEAARPLIAEALRQTTEALGKVPEESKLAEALRLLTEQQMATESGMPGLQAKLADLTAAVATADAQLKETNAQLEKVGRESGAAAEQVKLLDAQSKQFSSAVEAARKAAQPVETELAAAQQAVARWQGEIVFRNQMAELQKELEAARKVAAGHQAELDKANEQLAAVQSTANAAKAKVDEASRGVDAVSEKIDTARGKK